MSSTRNTVVRSMHDVGLATWFGGSLMGAIGLNAAAASATDPTERAPLASAGLSAWAPANATAIGAHLIGGAGLLLANRNRVGAQQGVAANTVVKIVLTGAALASTAASGVLGSRVATAGRVPASGATEPSDATPDTVGAAQAGLRRLQWLTPALTGALVVLGAQQGEQQRPAQVVRGVVLGAASSAGRRLRRAG